MKRQNTETKPAASESSKTQSDYVQKVVSYLKYIIGSHSFFMRESLPYSSTPFRRYPIEWLKAYIKFMVYSMQDAYRIYQS